MPLKLSSFSINLPFGIGGMDVIVSEAQANAAWALYVELATRIATEKLEPGQGLVREALTSIYKLFDIIRGVLKDQGPGVAAGPNSVGPIAIEVLNRGLRPFLVRWHTSFSEFERAETKRQRVEFGADAPVVIEDRDWPERDAFYEALEENRLALKQYVDALGAIAGVAQSESDGR